MKFLLLQTSKVPKLSIVPFISRHIVTRSKKFSPKNKKDLGMACHIPPLKKAKKQGEMPLPSLGPIPKFYIFLMGWDRGWVMAFPLVSSLLRGVEYDRPSLNPFVFRRKSFASCIHFEYTLLSHVTPTIRDNAVILRSQLGDTLCVDVCV